MNTYPFLLAFLLVIPSAQATIRTVSNNPMNLAQFNTIQAAIDSSASGDTILVHGSTVNYAGFTIDNKKLTIIGPGWQPTGASTLRASVNSGSTIKGAGSSGTEIHGMRFNHNLSIDTNHPDDLKFVRNIFEVGTTSVISIVLSQASTTYSGYVFESNVFSIVQFSASLLSVYTNFLFINNYFKRDDQLFLNFANCQNFVLNHNLFYGHSTTVTPIFNSSNQITLSNNIFVRKNPACSNSSFNNNITYLTTPAAPWTVNNNIDNGGNIADMDPMMVDQASVNMGINNPLMDFTIASGPANGTASDGEDMGLLYQNTSSLNWTRSRNSRNPSIVSLVINNSVVGAGETLEVNVSARKNE